jgi:hypothetical protein
MMMFLGWGDNRLQSWKRPGTGFGLNGVQFLAALALAQAQPRGKVTPQPPRPQ